ncbi:MAG: EAL domain-containing protein [Devosia sp.]
MRFGERGLSLIFGTALLVAAGLGLFRPIDDALRDLRFAEQTRAASGNIVFVDIDAASLKAVGVWPWPRGHYAKMLDRLMAAGAAETVFDIDFSASSDPAGDADFARALEAAGGYAFLAAFRQKGDAYNLPLSAFRQFAEPVAVNVALDEGGIVRVAPYGLVVGPEKVASAASVMSGAHGPVDAGFAIDYSIDPASIDRISAIDLIEGRVDATRIAGKQAIIGASALELRDFFVVPRHGIVPGALLQILAAETLKQGRALEPLAWQPMLWVAALAGLAALVWAGQLGIVRVVATTLAMSVAAEAAALLLQVQYAALIDTAVLHLMLAAIVLRALLSEVRNRGRLHARASRERDETQRILDRVIADNFDGVVIVNSECRIVAASGFAEEMLGKGLVGQSATEILPPNLAAAVVKRLGETSEAASESGESVLQGAVGERTIEHVLTRSEIGRGAGLRSVVCLTFRDVTERRRAEARLKFLSGHDPLTGALNRNELVENVQGALERDSGSRGVALVAVDLRRFRLINDTLGHSLGDALLKQVAGRLQSMGPDAVARLGGGTFLLLVPETDPKRLMGFAETVSQYLSFPYELEGHQAVIAASAGATTSNLSGTDPDVLLSHADMALSAAKAIAGSAAVLFSPEMDAALRQKRTMDGAVRRALLNQDFHLVYQPQVEMESGRVVGVEALARWNDRDLGAVSPVRFIPVAEETGLIVELGQWILDAACRQASAWPGEIEVAVNASPVQFELSDVPAQVEKALEKSGLAASRLTIEITEGFFVGGGPKVTNQLERLREMGVKIALDDFGTGYSSLGYLGRLPIDKIKIDQSFVRKLPQDQQALAIIQTIVTLAGSLDKAIVVEGVETADQAWMLRLMGCKIGQGYHLGRPAGPEAISELFATAQERLSA